ncbi:MAG TPA: type IV pilin protein [Burkholderiaceae bacterium]|nr:type IV pilin protein [Burkholderiaceae bacterium]
MTRGSGFSLIEVLIVLVLLAVLASIAVPGYQAQVRRTRRAEAVAAMLALQQAQERWRASHPDYAAGLGNAGLPGPTQTPSGRHALSTAVEDDTRSFAYTVTAVATQPAGDSCAYLQLSMLRGSLTQRSGPDARLGNGPADNRACWGQ